MKRKNIIIITSTIIIVVASGSLAMLAKIRRNSKLDLEYLQSDEFRNLDPNTRRTTARSVMRQAMTDSAEKYAKLPPEQRTDYLDKIIDTMETRRREFRSQQDGTGRREERRQRWRNRKPEDARERRESVDPETREKMDALRRAIRQRRRERRGD